MQRAFPDLFKFISPFFFDAVKNVDNAAEFMIKQIRCGITDSAGPILPSPSRSLGSRRASPNMLKQKTTTARSVRTHGGLA